MRNLFLVLAKLLGLVFVYWALTDLSRMVLLMMYWVQPAPYAIQGMIWQGVNAILNVGVGILLITRAEWLATRLGIRADDLTTGGPPSSGLVVGMRLIGVYVTCLGAPGLLRALIVLGSPGRPVSYRWMDLVPEALELGIGLLLVLRSDLLAERITNSKTSLGDKGSASPA